MLHASRAPALLQEFSLGTGGDRVSSGGEGVGPGDKIICLGAKLLSSHGLLNSLPWEIHACTFLACHGGDSCVRASLREWCGDFS